VYVKGRIICLFGCGGNRSLARRYEMGETAAQYADLIIITSDNPRYENARNIMDDIEKGVLRVLSEKDRNNRFILIEDRKDAIEMALSKSCENDMIVIAGKGHEPYQILKDKTIHFDDREQVEIQFQNLKNNV
jgi:UDP-N-acetylmuramoyl-L-alanyl-D-glutamate--2,6-diaminopimelate ligase